MVMSSKISELGLAEQLLQLTLLGLHWSDSSLLDLHWDVFQLSGSLDNGSK